MPARPARALAAAGAGCLIAWAGPALAQEKKDPPRDARYTWNHQKTQLYMDVSFRDIVDAEIRKKLSRGLPTTIVLTAAVHQVGSKDPVSTTAQTCKITWHVWDEVYLVETTRPGGSKSSAAISVDGVIRRCADARRLPIGTSAQVPVGASIYLTAKVQVNPVSAEILNKIKRWVSRPTGTATRKLPPTERKALEILDARDTWTRTEIRKQYKSLVKDLHPDMNGGDRSDEERLQEVVWAWDQIKDSRYFKD